MKIKNYITTALVIGSIFSFSYTEATPTMTQSVSIPQELMNPNENSNYLLVWSNLGSKFYIDLSSIVVKRDDDKIRWWAVNVVELNKKGEYVRQFPREFCYDRTTDKTKMWDYNAKEWDEFFAYSTKTRIQLEARAFNLSFIFAFQGGFPLEK